VAARGGYALGVAVSPDGKSLYVTMFFSNSLSQFDVGPDGKLSAKTPATVPAGAGPAGIAVASVPTSKEQCKHGGWKQFGFKNQGQCIRFVQHGQKK
jgi:hypothetical protein